MGIDARLPVVEKSSVSELDRFGLTLFIALVLHAILILGVGFTFEERLKRPSPERTLEIMVVRHPAKPELPKEADLLAQVSQQGGGEEKEPIKPTVRMDPPPPRKRQRW